MTTLNKTYQQVLQGRNKELYYKWLYSGELSNCEVDEIEICSRITRKITGEADIYA